MSEPEDDWDYYLLDNQQQEVTTHTNNPGQNEEGVDDSFQITSSGMYSIRVENVTRNCTFTSSTININLPNITPPGIQASPSTAITCSQLSITLTASPPQGATISSYEWLKNNAVIAGQTGSTLVVNSAGNYKTRVVYVNNGPCKVESAQVAIQDQTANTRPSIAIEGPIGICLGESAALTATSNTGTAFSWSTGATTAGITVSPNATTAYTVTVTNTQNGCVNSISKTVNVNEKPDVGEVPRTFSVTTGSNLVVNLIQAGATNLTTANWFRQETINIASGAPATLSGASPNLTPQLSETEQLGGIRYAVVPANGGCVGDTFLVTIKVLPIIEDGIYVPEVLSPNGDGVNDLWEVVVPAGQEAADFTVVMYNRAGGKVYENTLATAWDASGCPDGVYYYKITKGGELIKQGALTIIGKNQ